MMENLSQLKTAKGLIDYLNKQLEMIIKEEITIDELDHRLNESLEMLKEGKISVDRSVIGPLADLMAKAFDMTGEGELSPERSLKTINRISSKINSQLELERKPIKKQNQT